MKRINWVNTIFLILSPIIVAIFIPVQIIKDGFHGGLVYLFLVSCLFTSLSITGGYHRLFAHTSYQANKLVELFYLVFGAAAMQGSALKWCSDHRRHHRYVDTQDDPYNIQKGFLFAHIGWVFLKEDLRYRSNFAPDLANDHLVQWQHRYYSILAVLIGFGFPTFIGWLIGHPWGGLLYGGFARVVFTHHCTFLINSLCHMWGTQPYSNKTSARDNPILAFFTYGEGFHNFHHRFASDYRNGIRWYHWDPTKWTIKILSFFKLTKNLVKVTDGEILKAELSHQEKVLGEKGFYDQRLEALKVKIIDAQKRIQAMRAHYRVVKNDFTENRKKKIKQIQIEIKLAKYEMRASLNQWRLLYKHFELNDLFDYE